MYLMNVPPVAATHTEWRTCGPHKGYSLPNFFNDSDTELSTRDAPISDKVQMIIESLRSSQSSLEMCDEIEGNALSGQEGHPKICKVAVGSYLGAKSKTESPTANEQAGVSSPLDNKSSDSDSDDSVDRGIEEAILEYLKEKDDHKRKAEPCFTFLQTSKISRKTPPIPEVSKHNPDSNALLIASNQFTEIVEVETQTASAVVPIKKHIQNKESLNDNTVKKLDPNKNTAAKSLVSAKEKTKSFSIINKIKCPVTVKVEEDSNDSSSDDGIEEAIQRYQLEKMEQQNKREAINLNPLKEESDSTSDDGIEEAIRCYQLEQLKEKSVLKPLLHKQKPFNRSLMPTVGNTSMENSKKHKLKKKRARMEKEVKCLPLPPSIFTPKNTLADSSNVKGNGLHLFKVERFKEQPQPTQPPPKVNTTAELMCAEAILDISKTVMPGAFHHSVGLSSCAPAESPLQCSLPSSCSVEESEVSSIDSEDGIEQEIRRFLEQKAQMRSQPSSSASNQEPPSVNEPDKVKAKQVASKKNPSKLSLTQRRRKREVIYSIPNMSPNVTHVKDATPKPDHEKDSNLSTFAQKNQTHPAAGLDKTEQIGDKSSSLDSDEDLDTAIKDLLKTKKKSKKKVRDLKRKSRKLLKDEEQMLGNSPQTKKFKPDIVPKFSTLKKVQKSKDDSEEMSGLSKMNVSQYKQVIECEGHDMCEDEKLLGAEGQDAPLLQNTQDNEDGSSVDSDDSIEQEIRRFLAEKAMVSTSEKARDDDISRNGTAVLCTPLQNEDVKQENQLAEIPRQSIGSLYGHSPLRSQTLSTPQSLSPVTSTVCAQLPMTSVQSSSPSFLEPADGAGAARTQQMRPRTGKDGIQDVSPQMERVRPVLSLNAAHSHSESIKWRQSLGLPITDTRTLSRTPFHITSSKIRETTSATPKVQSRVITPKSQSPFTICSATKTSRATLPCSAGMTVNTTIRSPVSNILCGARQLPRMSFTQSLAPGIRSQCPIEGERESMVHVPKDKSVFVELESNRTNHVQVQSSDRSKGKDRVDLLSNRKREGEIDEKEVHLERTDGEFIDEAQCESGSRRNPEKQQGLSALSLSSAIDPGITFRPCIALTTEERSRMFNRRYLTSHCKKALPSLGSDPVPYRTMQHVKRKLRFIPVGRKNEELSNHNNKIK